MDDKEREELIAFIKGEILESKRWKEEAKRVMVVGLDLSLAHHTGRIVAYNSVLSKMGEEII